MGSSIYIYKTEAFADTTIFQSTQHNILKIKNKIKNNILFFSPKQNPILIFKN